MLTKKKLARDQAANAAIVASSADRPPLTPPPLTYLSGGNEQTPRSPESVPADVSESSDETLGTSLSSDALSNFELNLDNEHEEEKARRKEFDRLARRQTANENEYEKLKKAIIRAKVRIFYLLFFVLFCELRLLAIVCRKIL